MSGPWGSCRGQLGVLAFRRRAALRAPPPLQAGPFLKADPPPTLEGGRVTSQQPVAFFKQRFFLRSATGGWIGPIEIII